MIQIIKTAKLKWKKYTVLLFLLAVGTVSGCKSSQYVDAARKVANRNPHAAIEYLAIALQEDMDNRDAIATLDSTIGGIRRDYETRQRRYKNSGKFDLAVAECDRMIATSAVVEAIPGRGWKLNFKPEERLAIANNAAENFYQKGIKCRDEKLYKEAVTAFDRANGFIQDYKDAKSIRTEIIAQAIQKIYIKPIFVTQDRDKSGVAKVISEAIIPFLLEKAPRFVKLVDSPTEASLICEVAIQSLDFVDSGRQHTSDKNSYSYEVKDKEGNKSTVTKSARWEHYTHTTSFKITSKFSLRDVKTNNLLKSETSDAARRDTAQWVNFYGDKEALPSKLKKLSNSAVTPASKSRLAKACAEEASKKLAHKLFLIYK